MRRRERRPFEVFSLSFLDVVCCGFGAIILLFVLNKMGEPAALERAQQDLSKLLARLEERLERRGARSVLPAERQGRRDRCAGTANPLDVRIVDRRRASLGIDDDVGPVQGDFRVARR